MKDIEDFYTKKIVSKPWGYEYVIYNFNKKLAITFLKINYGHKTSLHCHTRKKTGFIILGGKAKVQYGIYKENTKIMQPLKRLIFRPGLFHSIEALSKNGLYLLETENPYDKNDLVRLEDKYGRKAKKYEGKNFTKNLTSKYLKFKKPTYLKRYNYSFNNLSIVLEKTDKLKKLNKNDYLSSTAILDGSLVDNHNQNVISSGEIVKTSTLKILSKSFKMIKPITILTVSKNINKNYKIDNVIK